MERQNMVVKHCKMVAEKLQKFMYKEKKERAFFINLYVFFINLFYTPVVTLLEHLGSNMCSKFHKNMGMLKPIARNHDMGVFLTWYFMQTHTMGIYSTIPPPQMSQLHFKPISVQIRAFAEMLDSFEIGKFFARVFVLWIC